VDLLYTINRPLQVWVVSSPLTILNSPSVSDSRDGGSGPGFGTSRDIAGVLLWALGFVIETVADAQKVMPYPNATLQTLTYGPYSSATNSHSDLKLRL